MVLIIHNTIAYLRLAAVHEKVTLVKKGHEKRAAERVKYSMENSERHCTGQAE